jgi:hypothetical protein
MSLRGKSGPSMVYRIDWQREVPSEFLTMQAGLDAIEGSGASLPLSLELSWLDIHGTFMAADMPMYLGRGNDAKFIVNNQTVSRLHARIEQRGEAFVIIDVSSYGTWVRFAGSDAAITLRRQECVLLDKGEIALGAPFDDFSVPTVSFRLNTPTSLATGYSSLL